MLLDLDCMVEKKTWLRRKSSFVSPWSFGKLLCFFIRIFYVFIESFFLFTFPIITRGTQITSTFHLLFLFLCHSLLLHRLLSFCIRLLFFWRQHDISYQLKVFTFEETVELLAMLSLDRIVLYILFCVKRVFELRASVALNLAFRGARSWALQLIITWLSSSWDCTSYPVTKWLEPCVKRRIWKSSFIESSVFHNLIPFFLL